MEVTSGRVHQGINRIGNQTDTAKKLNEAEDRKKSEEASHKLTPAAAERQAVKHAKASIGRYLNEKA